MNTLITAAISGILYHYSYIMYTFYMNCDINTCLLDTIVGYNRKCVSFVCKTLETIRPNTSSSSRHILLSPTFKKKE